MNYLKNLLKSIDLAVRATHLTRAGKWQEVVKLYK